MTLWLRESGGAIKGAVEYNTDLFSAQRVQRFIGHYKQLLTAIVNNPQQRVSELPLLTETEQQLLQGFNDTARALPQAELCAHQLFEEQVARTPEAVALIAEDEQLSYAELNGRANQLAHYLRTAAWAWKRWSASVCHAVSISWWRCWQCSRAALLTCRWSQASAEQLGSAVEGDGRHAGAHRGRAGAESAAGVRQLAV